MDSFQNTIHECDSMYVGEDRDVIHHAFLETHLMVQTLLVCIISEILFQLFG